MSRKMGSFEISDEVEGAIATVKTWLAKERTARNHNRLEVTIDDDKKVELRAFPKSPADLEREAAAKKAAAKQEKDKETLAAVKGKTFKLAEPNESPALQLARKTLAEAEAGVSAAQKALDAEPENAKLKKALADAEHRALGAVDAYQRAGGKLG